MICDAPNASVDECDDIALGFGENVFSLCAVSYSTPHILNDYA